MSAPEGLRRRRGTEVGRGEEGEERAEGKQGGRKGRKK